MTSNLMQTSFTLSNLPLFWSNLAEIGLILSERPNAIYTHLWVSDYPKRWDIATKNGPNDSIKVDECNNGSYKGAVKRETVYKGANKDYLPEAKPRANDHFTCKAKQSKGKKHCPQP